MSRSIPLLGGPAGRSLKRFRGIRHRNIYCGIEMASMGVDSEGALQAWASKSWSQRREALVRMPLWNA
jgi:hypothetical protein